MDEIYTIPENPEYSESIRKLQNEDPVDASSIINPLVERLIENTAAVWKRAEAQGVELGKQSEELGRRGEELAEVQQAAALAQRTAALAQQAAVLAQQTADMAGAAAEGLTAQDVGAVAASDRGAANGVASLGSDGKVPTAQLPSLAPYVAGASAPSDRTKLWIDTNATTGGLKYWNGSAWTHVPVAYT